MAHLAENNGGEARPRITSFDVLRKFDWSPRMGYLPNLLDAAQRVSTLNTMPRREWRPAKIDMPALAINPAAIAAAYYAFEAGGGVMPFNDLFRHRPAGLNEVEDDSYRLGAALALELRDASEFYSDFSTNKQDYADILARIKHNIRYLTRAYDRTNLGALAALETMTRRHAGRDHQDKDVANEASYMVRMLVAKDLGRSDPRRGITEYRDLLKPIFPEEEDLPLATE